MDDLDRMLLALLQRDAATLLLKVRTTSTAGLQGTLRRIFEIDGVASTEAAVVLETFFERPIDPAAEAEPGRRGDSQAMDGQRAR